MEFFINIFFFFFVNHTIYLVVFLYSTKNKIFYYSKKKKMKKEKNTFKREISSNIIWLGKKLCFFFFAPTLQSTIAFSIYIYAVIQQAAFARIFFLYAYRMSKFFFANWKKKEENFSHHIAFAMCLKNKKIFINGTSRMMRWNKANVPCNDDVNVCVRFFFSGCWKYFFFFVYHLYIIPLDTHNKRRWLYNLKFIIFVCTQNLKVLNRCVLLFKRATKMCTE